ncbi:MAG: protein kinase [Oligoflexia bacterium]|nr:protein kinase [Oligoflexia bacterium]
MKSIKSPIENPVKYCLPKANSDVPRVSIAELGTNSIPLPEKGSGLNCKEQEVLLPSEKINGKLREKLFSVFSAEKDTNFGCDVMRDIENEKLEIYLFPQKIDTYLADGGYKFFSKALRLHCSIETSNDKSSSTKLIKLNCNNGDFVGRLESKADSIEDNLVDLNNFLKIRKNKEIGPALYGAVYTCDLKGVLVTYLELFNGDLVDYIKKRKTPYLERLKLYQDVFQQITLMHADGFVHMDIKPDNILVKEKTSTYAKITDFGLMLEIDPTSGTLSSKIDFEKNSIMGTYMAPEVFDRYYKMRNKKKKEVTTKEYISNFKKFDARKFDVFSLCTSILASGIISKRIYNELYEYVGGFDYEQMKNELNTPRRKNVGPCDELEALLADMCEIDHHKRLSLDQATIRLNNIVKKLENNESIKINIDACTKSTSSK